jgi:hypothetical protein
MKGKNSLTTLTINAWAFLYKSTRLEHVYTPLCCHTYIYHRLCSTNLHVHACALLICTRWGVALSWISLLFASPTASHRPLCGPVQVSAARPSRVPVCVTRGKEATSCLPTWCISGHYSRCQSRLNTLWPRRHMQLSDSDNTVFGCECRRGLFKGNVIQIPGIWKH